MSSSVGFLLVGALALSMWGQFLCSASEVGNDADSDASVPLRIASFNVQVFGNRKMKRQLVRNVLVKVIQRYDIVLIQEIRSASNNAINDLLKLVNNAAAPREYGMELSARLGRSNSKEQYAFLYRKDRVSIKDRYLFNDAANGDKFEREPFVVRFNSPNMYVKDFAIGGIHVSPGTAPQEISDLVDVYDDIVSRWKLHDVILMGDFNAGCSYVTKSEWKTIRLATDNRFYWAFTNDQDTTVAKSDCPYDKMVMAGKTMVQGVVANSAKVFRFDIAYKLTQHESEIVSDHYPIEIKLKDSSYKDEELYITKNFDFVNRDTRSNDISRYNIYALRSKNNKLLEKGFIVQSVYTKSGSTKSVTLKKATSSIDEAVTAVELLHRHFPKLVSSTQAIVASRQLKGIFGHQSSGCSLPTDKKTIYQVFPAPHNPLSALSIKVVQLICNMKGSECFLAFETM